MKKAGFFLGIFCLCSSGFAAQALGVFDPYKVSADLLIHTLNSCAKAHQICSVSVMSKYGLPVAQGSNVCSFKSSGQLAVEKSLASALFGEPTSVLQIFSKPGGILHGINYTRFKTNRISFIPGAYPLRIKKKLFGAVGVFVQLTDRLKAGKIENEMAQKTVNLWRQISEKPSLLSSLKSSQNGISSGPSVVALRSIQSGIKECDKLNLGCFIVIRDMGGIYLSMLRNSGAPPAEFVFAQERAKRAATISVNKADAGIINHVFPNGLPLMYHKTAIGGIGIAVSTLGMPSMNISVSVLNKDIELIGGAIQRYFSLNYKPNLSQPCARI